MKTCRKCQVTMSEDQFYAHPTTSDRVDTICKPCKRTYTREYKTADPKKQSRYNRKHQLRYKFGISLEEFDAMLKKQGGICAIRGCGARHEEKNGCRLAVDHCHASGRIRALLCLSCNSALGLLGEDAERIRGLAEYAEANC